MTEAMPFLQKTILLSYDPRPFNPGFVFYCAKVFCDEAGVGFFFIFVNPLKERTISATTNKK